MIEYIDKAKECIDKDTEEGLGYLNKAQEIYEQWNGRDKKDEIKMTLDSIAYAYANPGEPIK